MSFQEHTIKTEYRSLIDNVVQKFYVPLLKEAVSYKRAVGFFSSSSLIEISKGIADLASRDGRIQIVASPYLSDDDIEAIKKGYADRDEVIEAALLGQLSDEHTDYYSMERLNLLANLIANGVLDIRIAYTEDTKGLGMYHEKMGIIEDAAGNKIAFSGSMNESSTAMSLNYETIDVFRSWYDEGEAERVRLKENAFSSIWSDCEPSIRVLEFPKITDALIEKYRKKTPNFNIDQEQFPPRRGGQRGLPALSKSHGVVGARIPQNITLHDYQKQAISAWVGENYRGIFDMATGTGVIAPYKDEHFLLVYCGATNVLPPNSDRSDVNEGDIKQIEAVTRILGNELGMKVSKFTAEENIDERNAIKQHFKDGDDLQAIVAIKCLDEGVNIPGIRTAFILASTTNPKEYIQRRGRVLRKSPETGKKFAEIFDFVTLPRPLDEVSGLTQEQMRRDLPLVKNELARVLEFGRLSMNSMEASQLIWEICDCYGLPYDLNDDEKEDPYGDSEVRP
jgi:hypothetical protein